MKLLNLQERKSSLNPKIEERGGSTFHTGRINFHILLQNPGSNFNILGALQNHGSSHPSLTCSCSLINKIILTISDIFETATRRLTVLHPTI